MINLGVILDFMGFTSSAVTEAYTPTHTHWAQSCLIYSLCTLDFEQPNAVSLAFARPNNSTCCFFYTWFLCILWKFQHSNRFLSMLQVRFGTLNDFELWMDPGGEAEDQVVCSASLLRDGRMDEEHVNQSSLCQWRPKKHLHLLFTHTRAHRLWEYKRSFAWIHESAGAMKERKKKRHTKKTDMR